MYKAFFEQLAKQAVKVDFSDNGAVGVGASKFGGEPDLPEGFAWPRYEGGGAAERPLSFLVQIRCEDVAPFDRERLLPEHGMLYFFYELDTMTWGFDPEDRGSARVCYHAGGPETLRRTPFPEDLEADRRMPELAAAFSASTELPGGGEFEEETGEEPDWDVYEEEAVLWGAETPDNRSQLLGYPDIIQNPMREQCEMVSNGVYCGGLCEDLTEEQREAFRRGAKDWVLLFQLDTVASGGFELMFGDCGRIYYYIRREDLTARRFENAWLILQCC